MTAWWMRLLSYARPHGLGLAGVVALTLVGVALQALGPWPLKLIIDNVLVGQPLPEALWWLPALPGGGSPSSLLGWLALATVALFIVRRVAQITRAYLQHSVGTRLVYRLGAELFDRLQRLSLCFHYQQRKGDLVRRVTTDCRCVDELLMQAVLPLLTAGATLAMMLVVMWQLDRSVALVALLVALPLGLLIRLFSQRIMERTYDQQEIEGQLMALAEQNLTALPAIQAFGREEHEDRRFRSLSAHAIRAGLQTMSAQLQFQIGVSAATAVGTAVIMMLAGFHVLYGSMSIGGLVVVLAYLAALYAPLETLANLSSGFAAAAARARRVFQVLEAGEEVREAPGAWALSGRARGQVRLEAVTVGYEPGRPVLEEVSLEAGPGETIALVGPTGAGKSSLVSLIPRFLDPWQGRVSLDGVDVRTLTLASLRAQVAVVLQEPFLLPLSVAENIAYGRPGADRAEIVAAAVAANADEFIERLPAGYDTVLSESGATLSGGQRQRLALARAFLKDAPVLILDEPTSALDAATEATVMEAAARLMRGRTTFIIAHRLSTVRRADRIAVLEAGRVVEAGSHRALLAAGGLYQHLHRLQTGSAGATASNREEPAR
jgi:ATP-binding cassette, subfamily B, bacterial